MKFSIAKRALFLGFCLFATLTVSAQTISPYYEPLSYGSLASLKNNLYGATTGTAGANDCSNSPAKFKGQNVIYVSPNGTDYASSTVPYVPGKPLQSGTGANAVVKPGQLVCFQTGTYKAFIITTSGTDYNHIVRFEVVPGNIATIDLTCGGVIAGCDQTNQQIYGGIQILPPSRLNPTNATYVRYVLVSGFFVHGPDDALSTIPNEGTIAAADPYGYHNAGCIVVAGNQGGSSFVAGGEADHIYIVANTLEGCPGGGALALYSDYVTIDGNIIYDTDWYTVYAGSAISLFSTLNTNPNDPAYPSAYPHTYKNYIVNNTIFNNFQFVANGKGAGAGAPGTFSDGEGIIIDTNMNSAAGSSFDGPTSCPNPDTSQYCVAPYSSYTLVSNNQLWGNGSSAIETTLSQNVDITFNTMFNNDLNGPEQGRAEITSYDSLDINVSSNLIYTSGFDSQLQQIYDGTGQGLPYISVLYPYIGTLVYENNTGYSCEGAGLAYPAGYPPTKSNDNAENFQFANLDTYACSGALNGGEYAPSYDTVYNAGGLTLAPTSDPYIQNTYTYTVNNRATYMGLTTDILGTPRPPNQIVAAGAFVVAK